MKIIDLLVKISKGKKMPKNIKYKGYVWEKLENSKHYIDACIKYYDNK